MSREGGTREQIQAADDEIRSFLKKNSGSFHFGGRTRIRQKGNQNLVLFEGVSQVGSKRHQKP
jgi:hypothetical protein